MIKMMKTISRQNSKRTKIWEQKSYYFALHACSLVTVPACCFWDYSFVYLQQVY